MGLHGFFNNFIGGMTFGMLSNTLYRMNPIGWGYCSCPMFTYNNFQSSNFNPLLDNTFQNSFPSIDFSDVSKTIWDIAEKRTSEYCKQLDEYNKKLEEYQKENPQYKMNFSVPQYEMPFSTFYYPNQFMTNMYSNPLQSSVKRDVTEKKDNEKTQRENTKIYFDDKRFSIMLNIVLGREGGYSNDPDDRGGETMKGVTTETYNAYRKSKGLPTQSVKKITEEEMSEIYYDIYKTCGADKITDKKLALYVFDTAVNMGSKAANEFLEKSGGDLRKYESLRRARYREIAAKDSRQKKYLNGWNNRVYKIRQAAENSLTAIA